MSAAGRGKKAVYALLKAASSVTNIATGGIYSGQIKQGATPPFILITEEQVRPFDTKTDLPGVGATTNIHELTISVYARPTASDGAQEIVESLYSAVDVVLNHYSGTIGGVVVDDIRFTDARDDSVEDIHYKDLDYEVWTKQ